MMSTHKKILIAAAETLETLQLGAGDAVMMDRWGEKTECGTVACAAGWLLIKGALPGYKPFWAETQLYAMPANVAEDQLKGGVYDDRVIYVGDAARQALKLPWDRTDDCFYHSESLQETAALLRGYAATR